MIATLVQLLLPLPWLRGLDGRLRLAIDWRDPAVKRVFVLMLPVTLGLGLINVNALIGTFFAARCIDKTIAPSAIDAAFRIYMVPQGMFSVAVATVLFPSLARLAARRDDEGFRHTVGLGLRQIAFLLIPASVRRLSSPSRSSGSCTSAASSMRIRPRSSRAPWPRSRSA